MSIECSVVVPLCNEELNLPNLHLRLTATLRRLAIPYEIIYVDDGSTDRTSEMIRELNSHDSVVKAIFLSRNFGHQAALCAGIEAAAGRAVVTLDGDLQNPPELIPEMIDRWNDGYQIVNARPRKRLGNPLKQAVCFLFYRVLRSLVGISIPPDIGNYRLMDRQVVDQLNVLPERTRSICGLVNWVGFRQTEALYDCERRHTKSKYAKLAPQDVGGLFGSSVTPLKAITIFGLCVLGLAIAALLSDFAGFLSVSSPGLGIVLLGGMQMVFLGVMGEYVARIHNEVCGRPLYVTQERLGFRALPRPAPNVLEFLPSGQAARQEPLTAARLGSAWTDPALKR